MKTLTLYGYSSCDTCRRAAKWLRAHGFDFVEKPIRETPPSRKDLRAMLVFQRGELRRLFNTAGKDYREQALAPRLPTMSEDEAFSLLSSNGNLVKRPFLLGPAVGLVGFDETLWAETLKPAHPAQRL